MRLGGGPGEGRLHGLTRAQVGLGACGLATLFLVAGILLGIANVEITEYGLKYSLLTRKAGKKAFSSGRYWIGPTNYFITFPAVLRTIQFSDSKLHGSDLSIYEKSEGLLRSRTKDGLDVQIELSFQYQLKKDELYDLYTNLGGNQEYHATFTRVAVDLLTESATTFTANEFFVDRNKIGKVMEAALKQNFEGRLFATVFSFQLRSVELPTEFEDAIQMTEVKKQDVRVALAEQNSTRVSMETQLMQASRRTKVRMNRGEARAQEVMLANGADIAQYKVAQERSADGYARILSELDADPGEMLAYMETRILRDHRSDHVTLGLGSSGGR